MLSFYRLLSYLIEYLADIGYTFLDYILRARRRMHLPSVDHNARSVCQLQRLPRQHSPSGDCPQRICLHCVLVCGIQLPVFADRINEINVVH